MLHEALGGGCNVFCMAPSSALPAHEGSRQHQSRLGGDTYCSYFVDKAASPAIENEEEYKSLTGTYADWYLLTYRE